MTAKSANRSGRPHSVLWSCPHCEADAMIRAGTSRTGHSQFMCRVCRRYVIEGAKVAVGKLYTDEQKNEALRLIETFSYREVGKILGIGVSSIRGWRKASGAAPKKSGRPQKTLQMKEQTSHVQETGKGNNE